jgi:hypothetical protein
MTKSEKSEYLLLFRHPREEPDPTPEEMQKIMGEWMDWMKSVSAKGQLRGANRLDDGGKVLRQPRGTSVIDGPFAEAKEIVGGYLVVAADDLAQATEIARGCPGLNYNIIVEVRPIEPLPPL